LASQPVEVPTQKIRRAGSLGNLKKSIGGISGIRVLQAAPVASPVYGEELRESKEVKRKKKWRQYT